MRTRQLAPFGIEIDDLQMADADAAVAAELTVLIARTRVAVFRGQRAGDDALVHFLGLFGALTFTDGETPVSGAPALNLVTNVNRRAPPRSVFHTDTSYVARPPSLSALRAVVLPGGGGDTLFSDQVEAVDRLPGAVREALAGRTVLHGATGVEVNTETTRHPLLRRHPVTGETAMYLSTPSRCTGLSGMDELRSARVIAALYWHSTRAPRLYRHVWRPGDVVVWDNRVTMHRADHSEVAGDRVMHRGMVLGERPIAA